MMQDAMCWKTRDRKDTIEITIGKTSRNLTRFQPSNIFMGKNIVLTDLPNSSSLTNWLIYTAPEKHCLWKCL